MVHQFFIKVAVHPGLVTHHASQAVGNSFGKQPFSNIFPIFFLDDAYVPQDKGLDSWMDAIANEFEFSENLVSPATVREVIHLFKALGFQDPRAPENVRVFKFWLYLFFLYEKLIEENCGGEGNTFAFMRGVKTTSIRVVLLGNLPVSNGPSTGYAFHGQKCQATNQMLYFLGKEMKQLSQLSGDPMLEISQSALDDSKQNCNFSGWITQGVLLLNACLTHHDSGPIYIAWQVFVNFVLRHLSFKVKGIAYTLLGEAVHHKEQFISLINNNLALLCHPDRYYHQNDAQEIPFTMDWRSFPPFLISNFFLYQKHGKDALIDFHSIGNMKPGGEWRSTRIARFFDAMIFWNQWAFLNGQRLIILNGFM